MKDQMGRAIAIFAIVFSASTFVLAFDGNFGTEIGEKNRDAGAQGLGATTGFVSANDLGWRPTVVEVINDGTANIQLGVRWYKDSSSSVRTYTPDLPAGSSLDLGGAEVDSVWVNHAGGSSSADSVYWTAAR